MTTFYTAAAAFLFLTVIAGLWRVLRGPDPGDRLMASQLFGTTAAAIMLLIAEAGETPGLRYLALVFASLAVVSVVAFARLAWPEESMEDES
jgi:multicomponent Na+:H+ antiporter subunit F